MKIKFIYVLFLAFCLGGMAGESHANRHPSKNELENDTYYQALIKKFPKTQDRRVIDKLYFDYSGWVIPLAERYGMPPLVALSETKDVESKLLVLYKYADIFMDLYNSFGKAISSEKRRASIALALLSAFSMEDEEQQDNYKEAWERAKIEDAHAAYRGPDANHYTRRLLESNLLPGNCIGEIKEIPEAYKTLLSELSDADAETLAACSRYPNALVFLLNTGKDGLRLIEKTNGQIIMLSWFLPDDEQKKLPKRFKEYPKLSEALQYCGADAYFTIMVCPELFFSLASRLKGSAGERYSMAYSVLYHQMEGEKETPGESAWDFFQNLSKNDCKSLAYYTAELMNLPEVDVEVDEEGNRVSFGDNLAPICEPLFFRFVLRYESWAIDIYTRFGAMTDISRLMMVDWRGDIQDITPLLESICEYGDMGMQAALYFRLHRDTQKFILDYPEPSRRTTLLMFWLYDALSAGHYTKNIGNRDDKAHFMLDNYIPDKYTGLPKPKDDSIDFVEFIPGYDIVVPIMNYWTYGKTPTLSEYFFAAVDLLQVIPIAISAGVVAKNIAENGLQSAVSRYAEEALKEPIKKLGKQIGNIIDDIAEFPGKFTLKKIKSTMGSAFKATKKRAIVLISQMSFPSWKDFSDFWSKTLKRAKMLPIAVLDLFGTYRDYVKGIYSKPWMTKRATETLIQGVTQEMLIEPTIGYMGINSLLDHLKR